MSASPETWRKFRRGQPLSELEIDEITSEAYIATREPLTQIPNKQDGSNLSRRMSTLIADRKAPTGQFRLICVDTFDGTDWIEGDYTTKEAAVDIGSQLTLKNPQMFKVHLYDEHGEHIWEAGSF